VTAGSSPTSTKGESNSNSTEIPRLGAICLAVDRDELSSATTTPGICIENRMGPCDISHPSSPT
jgi:hypothetical protein